MENVSSNCHWTNTQCRIIVPKHATTRIYWLAFILTACLKIFYNLARDQQNMTGIKGKLRIHLAMIDSWRIRIFSIRFTLNKFLTFFFPNSIITAYQKIQLWMVSLSTIGRLIYTQIFKFQMTQNETHHFNNAIWVIASSGKQSRMNILCINILSIFKCHIWQNLYRSIIQHPR